MPTLEEMLGDHKKGIALIRAGHRPTPRPGIVWLGVLEELKDPFPAYTGVLIENGWLGVPTEAFLGQTIILGKTGSGKTEFLKNISYQVMHDPRYNLVVVDGKGDQRFAEQSCSIASMVGEKTPVFKLGGGENPAVFGGFDGDSRAVYNRLVTMFSLETSLDRAVEHYNFHKRELLQLICGLNTDFKYNIDPIEPPRSFQELETRASEAWLIDAYKDAGSALNLIKGYMKGNPSDIQSLRADISSATTPFLNLVDPRGFRFGDHKLTGFFIDPAVAGFDAGYFFRFLAGYFGYYLSQSHKPTVFICDEFALFGPKNIVDLLNTARSKGGALILATQSIGTLGAERHIVDQIIDGPNLKFLFRSDLRPDVLQSYGTERTADISFSTQEGEAERQTTRYIEKFQIDQKTLKKFDPGVCMFEFGGLAKIRCVMIPDLPPFRKEMEAVYTIPKPKKATTEEVTAPVPF